MPKGNQKGSSFEREICKQLSLWWTDGQDDAVFWRSTTSGARAKVRSRVGKDTFGQYGDIQATNPIGQPLLDVCTIELKRGYGKASIADVLDAGPKAAKHPWEKWVEQAEEDSRNARTPHWMLITKRDRREAIVFMPVGFHDELAKDGYRIWQACPGLTLRLCTNMIIALSLSEFLRLVPPDSIKTLAEECA